MKLSSYEFWYANEYLVYENIADLTGEELLKKEMEADRKLELLLGTQKWRLFKFNPATYHKYDTNF